MNIEYSGLKLVKNENGKYDLVYFKTKKRKEEKSLNIEHLLKIGDIGFDFNNLKKIYKNSVISANRLLKEVAPPGEKYEKMILGLKKKFGEKSPIPFKIAWKKYREEKKKK